VVELVGLGGLANRYIKGWLFWWVWRFYVHGRFRNAREKEDHPFLSMTKQY